MNQIIEERSTRTKSRAVAVSVGVAAVLGAPLFMAPASAAPIGSIGDYVWHDADGDGLQDSWELGVEGVSVTLHDSTGAEILRTSTDADGFYSFTDLEAGEYTVGFEHLPAGAEFTTQGDGSEPDLDSDVEAISGRSGVVTITADAPDVDNIDAGVLMDGGPEPVVGSIGDFVWHDVNANGIQNDREWGLPGIRVSLYDEDGELVDRVTTDADGGYLFENLDYGTYTVRMSPPQQGWAYSPQGRGNDPELDSDIDPFTGRSDPVTIDADNPNDTSIDVGIFERQAPPK